MSSPSPIFDVSTLEVVFQDLGFSEGPITTPDGTILLVDIRKQCLTKGAARWLASELVAKAPGGPNGAAFGPDGRIDICQQRRLRLEEISTAERTGHLGGRTPSGGTTAADRCRCSTLPAGKLETLYTECAISTDMSGLGPRAAKEIPSRSPAAWPGRPGVRRRGRVSGSQISASLRARGQGRGPASTTRTPTDRTSVRRSFRSMDRTASRFLRPAIASTCRSPSGVRCCTGTSTGRAASGPIPRPSTAPTC